MPAQSNTNPQHRTPENTTPGRGPATHVTTTPASDTAATLQRARIVPAKPPVFGPI